MTTAPSPEQQVREHARAWVRAGLLSSDELHAEVAGAIIAELPDRADRADELATEWLDEAHDQLRSDQQGWPESTDYERLQTAFEELQMLDVDVVQGCRDEQAPKRLLSERSADGAVPRAVGWFTVTDVWRAVDEGLLALTLWHGSGATAAPDDEVVQEVLGVLEKHGLTGRFDEDHLEVDAHWHKRIAPA